MSRPGEFQMSVIMCTSRSGLEIGRRSWAGLAQGADPTSAGLGEPEARCAAMDARARGAEGCDPGAVDHRAGPPMSGRGRADRLTRAAELACKLRARPRLPLPTLVAPSAHHPMLHDDQPHRHGIATLGKYELGIRRLAEPLGNREVVAGEQLALPVEMVALAGSASTPQVPRRGTCRVPRRGTCRVPRRSTRRSVSLEGSRPRRADLARLSDGSGSTREGGGPEATLSELRTGRAVDPGQNAARAYLAEQTCRPDVSTVTCGLGVLPTPQQLPQVGGSYGREELPQRPGGSGCDLSGWSQRPQ